MIKKVFNNIKNNYIKYIIFIFFVLIFTIRFDYSIYSPGDLIDLTTRIEVDNSNTSKGSFNLTYVTSRKGTIINLLIAKILPSWDIIDNDENRIDKEDSNDIFKRNQIYLKETSYNAIIAAFNEANISYKIENIDVTITHKYEDFENDLKIGDIIKSINNVKVESLSQMKEEISKYNENDVIKINVLRDDKIKECMAKIKNIKGVKLIGVALASIKNVKTKPSVKYIFKNNESGASRGLMCALDIYNKITKEDLTKGYIIAGTGSIDENGKVGEIDGVKYKLKASVNAKAKVFIVPSDNYEEALKLKKENNYDIKLIKAFTLKNVIEELKKL